IMISECGYEFISSGNPVPSDWFDPLSGRTSGAGTHARNPSNVAAAVGQFNNYLGVKLPADLFVADLFNPSNETSTGEDPFLASFGNLGGPGSHISQDPRLSMKPSSDTYNYDLGLRLVFV